MAEQKTTAGPWENLKALTTRTVPIRLGIVVPLQILVLAAFVMFAPDIARRMADRSLPVATPAAGPSADSSADQGLGIEALIHDVKAELAASERAEVEQGHRALFEIKKFDLELSFVAQRSSRGLGKVDYQVVTAENEARVAAEQVQKLTLHFDAIPKEDGSSRQSDSDSEPTDSQVLGETPKEQEKAP